MTNSSSIRPAPRNFNTPILAFSKDSGFKGLSPTTLLLLYSLIPGGGGIDDDPGGAVDGRICVGVDMWALQ